jgi:transcriptional regulator of acetoin/glycerol metabolism
VRQLFNVLRTAAVMAANEQVITREHLSDDFLEESRAALGADAAAPRPAEAAMVGSLPPVAAPVGWPSAPAVAMPSPAAFAAAMPPAPPMTAPMAPQPPAPESPATIRSLEEQEIEAIQRAVDLAGGNISEASKRLGISRNTIYRKLRWKK